MDSARSRPISSYSSGGNNVPLEKSRELRVSKLNAECNNVCQYDCSGVNMD